jgi:hypothetical protein
MTPEGLILCASPSNYMRTVERARPVGQRQSLAACLIRLFYAPNDFLRSTVQKIMQNPRIIRELLVLFALLNRIFFFYLESQLPESESKLGVLMKHGV